MVEIREGGIIAIKGPSLAPATPSSSSARLTSVQDFRLQTKRARSLGDLELNAAHFGGSRNPAMVVSQQANAQSQFRIAQTVDEGPRRARRRPPQPAVGGRWLPSTRNPQGYSVKVNRRAPRPEGPPLRPAPSRTGRPPDPDRAREPVLRRAQDQSGRRAYQRSFRCPRRALLVLPKSDPMVSRMVCNLPGRNRRHGQRLEPCGCRFPSDRRVLEGCRCLHSKPLYRNA